LIADGDNAARRAEILRLIRIPGFEQTPVGGLLIDTATRGLFALLDDSELPELAGRVRSILDGSEVSRTIERLQNEIEKALNLQPILDAVQKTDFDALNGWLVGRLSALLEEQFDFGKLKQVQETIHKVITFRHKIYDKALQALNRRYDFSLAATWQKTTARTALLDAEFDMREPAASAMLQGLLRDADYDALLTQATPGVTLHKGMMSHAVERRSSIEVVLPYYASRELKFNQAIANVEAVEDQGRVLVYTLDAKDEVTRVNRFRSQVAASAALSLPVGSVRRHGAPQASWAYSLRMARRDMRAGELRTWLRPFVDQYLKGHFPDGAASSLDKWVADLDREVENATGNGPDEFGDVLLAAEVGLSGGVLAAWLTERSPAEARSPPGASRCACSLI
jgi:hypothetical protein